ncbi:MAG: hypothetical protein U9Q98_06635, partial [Bacteroidota bacterium]|nr:hypothetical protein [Bacteroidota bacterium]
MFLFYRIISLPPYVQITASRQAGADKTTTSVADSSSVSICENPSALRSAGHGLWTKIKKTSQTAKIRVNP